MIAIQSRFYYFFERVRVEGGRSMFFSDVILREGGEKRSYLCHESSLMRPMLFSLRKHWGLAAVPSPGLFLRDCFLPLLQSEQRWFFSFFCLLPQAKGSMGVHWLTTAIEGHLQWWMKSEPSHGCAEPRSVAGEKVLHQPLSMRKEALWPWLELGTSGVYLVLDRPFSLEPIWAALSRAETVVQPSPAAFCWFSLGVYCRTLFTMRSVSGWI